MKRIKDSLKLIKEVLPQDLLGRDGTMDHLCFNITYMGQS